MDHQNKNETNLIKQFILQGLQSCSPWTIRGLLMCFVWPAHCFFNCIVLHDEKQLTDTGKHISSTYRANGDKSIMKISQVVQKLHLWHKHHFLTECDHS